MGTEDLVFVESSEKDLWFKSDTGITNLIGFRSIWSEKRPEGYAIFVSFQDPSSKTASLKVFSSKEEVAEFMKTIFHKLKKK